MADESVMHFLSNRKIKHQNRKYFLGIQVAMRRKKSSQILVSAVSQRIYVPLSLQALDQSINGYFQENRVRFCAFWNQGHGLDNMLLHHFTLKESMSGLINEGRENDLLVFWPEI